MKKYTGLMVLAALMLTSFLAVKAAPNDRRSGRMPGDFSDAQIAQLDKRLNERVVEQQELLTMLEKMLHIDFQHEAPNRERMGSILSGQAKPPVLAARAVAVLAAPVPGKVTQAPWWEQYKPQMVYVSGSDRYAVVNNKMYTHNQSIGKEVFVDRIDDDSIVLRLGEQVHTYPLKK